MADYSHSTSLSNIYLGKTWDSLTTSAEIHRPPPPVPVNNDNEKFVTNVIQEIKHAILNQRINPFRAIKLTGNINQSENNTQNERNDVMHDKLNTHNNESAFCHRSHKNKSPHYSIHSPSKSEQQLIAITTRANPNTNTFEKTIIKRHRAPNKKNLQMETQIQNKLMCDTSTQTDPHSNKGKGLSVLDESKHADLFTAFDNTPTPDYRLNLMRVFNEEFIAENSKKDLGPIIDLVIKKDWNTLKKVNSIFYKIHRDLSVTTSGCLLYDKQTCHTSKTSTNGASNYPQ